MIIQKVLLMIKTWRQIIEFQQETNEPTDT